MPLTTVRYTGAAEPYFETALTGRPQSWRRGQTAEVDSAIATTLIASGLFVRSGDDFDGLIDPSGPKFVGEVEPAVRGAAASPSVANTFVLAGDSIANHNWYESASPVGGPYTALYMQNQSRMIHMVDGILGGRLNLVNNAGVSGERTDQILARWGNNVRGIGWYNGIGAVVNPLPGVSPFGAHLAGVIAGTNDILQGRSNSETLSGIISLWKKAQETGARKVFGATIPPYSGATSQLAALNRSIVDAARDYDVAMAFDFWGVMIDPTFAGYRARAGYTQDEGTSRLHPNNQASWWVAKRAAEVVRPYTTERNILPVLGHDTVVNDTNSPFVSANPLLTGTAAASGTNVSGNWISGCAVNAASNGATTRAFAKSTNADGYGENLEMTVVTTGAESNADCMLPSDLGRLVPGASYMAVGRIKLTRGDGSPLDGTENCIGVEMRMRAGYPGSINYWVLGNAVGATSLANGVQTGSLDMVVKTPVFTAPTDLGAATVFRNAINVQTSGATGAGGVKVALSQCSIVRVP